MAGEIQTQMLEEPRVASEPQDGTLPAGINSTAACPDMLQGGAVVGQIEEPDADIPSGRAYCSVAKGTPIRGQGQDPFRGRDIHVAGSTCQSAAAGLMHPVFRR
jgi:hypothetical protein